MSIRSEAFIEPAIRWAQEHVGSQAYAFLCLSFVEDAYEKANGIILDGYASAKEAADGYGTQTGEGLPPLGAWVFYDCSGPIGGVSKNWGHVGLYIGAGQVIHAWDKVRVDDYLEVQDLDPAPGWTKPAYLGWTPVNAVLRGMTWQMPPEDPILTSMPSEGL